MFIKSINWLNKDALEAEVIVSDNHFDILCFSHPFIKIVGEELLCPIHCLDAKNITLSQEKIAWAKRKSFFGYSVSAKLVNKKNNIIYLGDIELCLENVYIPNDISEGSFIEFDVSRFDLY